MTKRVKILTVSLGMTLAVSVVWFETITPGPASADGTYADSGRLPLIRPDYVDTVIPANISPLNFDIQEQGERYRVRIDSKQGEPIDLSSSDSSIDIPLVKWSQLLAANLEAEEANQRAEAEEAAEELPYDVLVQLPERLDVYF